jgi:cell shape-determining protein MreC
VRRINQFLITVNPFLTVMSVFLFVIAVGGMAWHVRSATHALSLQSDVNAIMAARMDEFHYREKLTYRQLQLIIAELGRSQVRLQQLERVNKEALDKLGDLEDKDLPDDDRGLRGQQLPGSKLAL